MKRAALALLLGFVACRRTPSIEGCLRGTIDEECRREPRRAPDCGGGAPSLCSVDARAPAPDGFAVLRGDVRDGSDRAYKPVPRAEVTAWTPGDVVALAVTADDGGDFAIVASPGTTLFFRADARKWLAELHAATLAPGERRMGLDVRSPRFYESVFDQAHRTYDPTKGIVVVELVGADGPVRASLSVAGTRPFVFDRPFSAGGAKPVDGDALVSGGPPLVIHPAVPPGDVAVTYEDSPTSHCRSQADVRLWPVRAGLVTQIDAVCERK